MSEVKTNKISPRSGTAFTLGDSGDTFTVPSGATLAIASGATIANSGTGTGFGGDNTPSFAAYNDAAQSIGSGSWTKLIFNTEYWDTDSAFDSSTNYRWTPGETGKYLIWSNVYLTSATYGDVKLYVYKNGSSTSYRYVMKQADGSGMEVVALMSLSSSDYVEMYLYAHGGTAVTEASASHFGGFKLVGV